MGIPQATEDTVEQTTTTAAEASDTTRPTESASPAEQPQDENNNTTSSSSSSRNRNNNPAKRRADNETQGVRGPKPQQPRSNLERYKKRLPEKSTLDVENDSHEVNEDEQFFSIRKSVSDHPRRGPDRMEELLSLTNREFMYSQGMDSTRYDVSELCSQSRVTKRAEK